MAEYQYGQVLYVSRTVGTSCYAEIREVSTRCLIGTWAHKPINGKVAIIRQCARKLGELDWKPVVTQRENLDHAILHPFCEKVQKAVRAADGRCLVVCPVCWGKKHAFSPTQ
jgi:hypothetical protein